MIQYKHSNTLSKEALKYFSNPGGQMQKCIQNLVQHKLSNLGDNFIRIVLKHKGNDLQVG